MNVGATLMRKLRDQYGQFILFGISVLCIAVGFRLYVKKIRPERQLAEQAALNAELKRVHTPKESPKESLQAPPNEQAMQDAVDRRLASVEEEEAEESDSIKSVPESAEQKTPFAELLLTESYKNKYDGNAVCSRMEYRGDGFQNTHFLREDWRKVLEQFHESKRQLFAWLDQYQSKLPEKAVVFMREQLGKAVLLSPPLLDELDLNWRGIGVWGKGVSGAPLIRVSSGFIRLVQQQPQRSQFEMTRLVAQGWAPCEFQRKEMELPLLPLLKCLDVAEESACDAGSYSEGGWAISTSFALQLSPPGCMPPAFLDPKKKECLQLLAPSQGGQEKVQTLLRQAGQSG